MDSRLLGVPLGIAAGLLFSFAGLTVGVVAGLLVLGAVMAGILE
jgi:hypothetical protein